MSSLARDIGHDAAPLALDFAGVAMTFPDGTEALQHVSLGIHERELVAVVGPSGCGKSTLLRIAAGLEAPTAGDVRLHTEPIGYVFQDATLLPWRTVQRNVELLGELHKLSRDEQRERAADAIKLVGLEGFEEHHPKRLSGGMKMRVSLARSLTMKPRVFLLDEPFGALDEITRERLNDELLRIFEHEGFAGLFITHSVYEAVYLASRVFVMSGRPGKMVGEVSIPFAYPRTPDLRSSPAFAELTGLVSASLGEGYR